MIRSLLPFFYLLKKIFKENDRIDKNIGSLGEKRRSKKLFKVRKQLEEVAMDFCSAITFRLGNSIHKVCTIVLHRADDMQCRETWELELIVIIMTAIIIIINMIILSQETHCHTRVNIIGLGSFCPCICLLILFKTLHEYYKNNPQFLLFSTHFFQYSICDMSELLC